MDHQCHEKASCLNVRTNYSCRCNKGFHGNGYNCTGMNSSPATDVDLSSHLANVHSHLCALLSFADINECLERGGENGHHCNSNTKCVNVYGSYECECLDGYIRSDKWNCVEINECTTGQHECDANATCTNTPGSFSCQCKDGFMGDGKTCVPVCEPRCLNGGKCIAPNVCECRGGYEGASCEKDLDECKTSRHGCTNTSICVNMPGWWVSHFLLRLHNVIVCCVFYAFVQYQFCLFFSCYTLEKCKQHVQFFSNKFSLLFPVCAIHLLDWIIVVHDDAVHHQVLLQMQAWLRDARRQLCWYWWVQREHSQLSSIITMCQHRRPLRV